jgi:hypothetical protein
MLNSELLVPQNVAVSEDGVFKEVTEVKGVVALLQSTGVPYKVRIRI